MRTHLPLDRLQIRIVLLQQLPHGIVIIQGLPSGEEESPILVHQKKGKMILFFLAAAMVLCACQADGEPQDINADASTLEQTEQKEPLSDGDKF